VPKELLGKGVPKGILEMLDNDMLQVLQEIEQDTAEKAADPLCSKCIGAKYGNCSAKPVNGKCGAFHDVNVPIVVEYS
jgi:hypothetical protein